MNAGPVANDRIPHRALVVLLPAMLLEVGVLRLSGELIAHAGSWAWLSAFILGLVSLLNILLIYGLLRRHNFPEFPQLLQALVGPWVAKGLLLLVGVAVLLRAARIARNSTELITQELLTNTPLWVVLISGLPVVAYIAWHGFEPVARYVAAIFPFYFTFMVLVLGLVLLRADMNPLIVPAEWSTDGLIRTVLTGIPDVQGYGMLFVVMPWVWRGHRALPSLFAGWLVVFSFFMLLMISTIAALGVSAASVTWATLDMVDLISVPGLFIERMESLFFIVWLFLLSTALLLSVFGCTYVLAAATVGTARYRWLIPVVVILVVAAALLPPTLATTDMATRAVRVLGWLEIFLPLLLWSVTLFRGPVGQA